MKLGTENRTKVMIAGGLMLVAVVVMIFSFGGSSPAPSPSPAPAVAPTAAPRAATSARSSPRTKGRSKKALAGPRSLDPTLRYDWLKVTEDTKYEGNGRNIFLAQAEIPQPDGNGTTDKPKGPEVPPPPPPPPPINLKFFGFASKVGEPKKVFLSEGEDIFVASEGDVVNRHYKVLKIAPASVEIEDVLNNNRQNIPLTAG